MTTTEKNCEQTNFLADTFDPESFIFSTPKKYKTAEIMASRIKNKNKERVMVQFPKMTVASKLAKNIELEFITGNGYTKKVSSFLSRLDDFVINFIVSHSEEWFGKPIPIENINQMYKRTNVTLKFVLAKSEFINKQNEIVPRDEIVKGNTIECISYLKYIVFTKDTCFLHWEICTAKIHKLMKKVAKFGFIDDPDDESDDELSDEDEVTFF